MRKIYPDPPGKAVTILKILKKTLAGDQKLSR